ncbi:hypothetical protein ANCDUO_23407, partial [Ancylostoma duodenale]
MQLFLLISFCLCVYLASTQEEPEGIDDEGADAEVLYNKTYSEYQTALEKAIFSNYVNTRRPVRNISTPVEVSVHFHIVHVSVNQEEQTMTVHGHLYMQAKVEMYPTFSIKVGCNFDYSDYPKDVNSCTLAVFAKQRMSE